MLTLSRYENEQVILTIPAGTVIPNDFSITVQHKGNSRRRTYLGFDAPDVVSILRSEIIGRQRKSDSIGLPDVVESL